MKKIIFLMATAFISLGIFSCADKNSTDEIVKVGDEFSPERIAELHNILLQRAIDEYFPVMSQMIISRSGEEVEVLNISGLIDFIASQPEISYAVGEDAVCEIKELFLGFAPDGIRKYNQADFLEYLKEKINEQYGVSYEDIISGASVQSTRAGVDSSILQSARLNALSVYNASCEFWGMHYEKESYSRGADLINSFNKTRANVSLVDMAGALWGTCLGGVGSIIAGGVASAVAETINNNQGKGDAPEADVKFWQTNPKWC